MTSPLRDTAQEQSEEAEAVSRWPWLRKRFWEQLGRPFQVDIGIDLGTANTLCYLRNEGIVINEPSVVAVTRGSHSIVNDGAAVGSEAKRMLGKTSHSVDVIRPLREGVIADFAITESMLRYFISKVRGSRNFAQTRVVIAIPFGITNAEMKAVYNSTLRAGADKVQLIEETLAAGLGAGAAVNDPTANLVVDIGGGTTGISVISVADIAYGTTVRSAGDHMNQAIVDFVRNEFGLQIGQQSAEQIKIDLGSAMPLDEERQCELRGQKDDGRPGIINIGSKDVREALKAPLGKILRGVDWVLENTPPELSADLVDRGILVTGGGALLPRIDDLISEHSNLAVTIADDPLSCVARGTGRYLEKVNWASTT